MILSGLTNEDREALERIYEERRYKHNAMSPYSRVDIKAKDVDFCIILETVLKFLHERPGWRYKDHTDTSVFGEAVELNLQVRKVPCRDVNEQG